MVNRGVKLKERKKQATHSRKRVIIASALVVTIFLLVFSIFVFTIIPKIFTLVIQQFEEYTVDKGLSVQHVYIDGIKNSERKSVLNIIAVNKNDPIVTVPINQIRVRLEEYPWVDRATVDRVLPDSLYIHIVEREPLMLWQNQDKISLIDRGGKVIQVSDLSKFVHLPLLVGKNAPKKYLELEPIIKQKQEISEQIASVILVGERRFDILLKDSTRLKLPSEKKEIREALDEYIKVKESAKLVDQKIKVIDFRAKDKIYIERN